VGKGYTVAEIIGRQSWTMAFGISRSCGQDVDVFVGLDTLSKEYIKALLLMLRNMFAISATMPISLSTQ